MCVWNARRSPSQVIIPACQRAGVEPVPGFRASMYFAEGRPLRKKEKPGLRKLANSVAPFPPPAPAPPQSGKSPASSHPLGLQGCCYICLLGPGGNWYPAAAVLGLTETLKPRLRVSRSLSLSQLLKCKSALPLARRWIISIPGQKILL